CALWAEAEPARARHVIAGAGGWCRKNPLLIGLSLVCLLLAVALAVTMNRARAEAQAAREAAEKAEQEARKAEKALPVRQQDLKEAGGNKQLARAVKMEAAKWSDKNEE